MINLFWLLLIPYTTIAYGIHGGEFITGINRQVRNLICALPFGLVAFNCFKALPAEYSAGLSFAFALTAFLGTNMGFDRHPLWLKGLITFPPLGAFLLPLAYSTEKTASRQEYLSGAFYGAALAGIAILA